MVRIQGENGVVFKLFDECLLQHMQANHPIRAFDSADLHAQEAPKSTDCQRPCGNCAFQVLGNEAPATGSIAEYSF